MKTLRKMVEGEMGAHDESFDDVVFIKDNSGLLHRDIDSVITQVHSFTIWTSTRVYFPVDVYEDRTAIESIILHPCSETKGE